MSQDLRATTHRAIHQAILAVAPDLDPDELADLDEQADFRDALDLDSMDFLNVLVALGKSTGVEIPEADYPQVRSLAGLQAYIERARPR